MRRFGPTLTAALLALLTFTSMGPAAAGGPTSALLSVPGEGKTASLYYTDHDYDRLASLVGIEGSGELGRVDESGLGHEDGPGVTVTWLIHDVAPWRVDHIYLEGKGAPWIATQLVAETGSTWDSPIVWHQPSSGAQLAALLDKLGVGAASRDAGDFNGVAGASLPPSSEPASEGAAAAEPSASTLSIADISWGLGGLVIGALVTGLWMRHRRSTPAGTGHSTDPSAHAAA